MTTCCAASMRGGARRGRLARRRAEAYPTAAAAPRRQPDLLSRRRQLLHRRRLRPLSGFGSDRRPLGRQRAQPRSRRRGGAQDRGRGPRRPRAEGRQDRARTAPSSACISTTSTSCAPHGLADLFNEFLAAVEEARREGRISKDRKVGYVAKNNAAQFQRALEREAARCAAALPDPGERRARSGRDAGFPFARPPPRPGAAATSRCSSRRSAATSLTRSRTASEVKVSRAMASRWRRSRTFPASPGRADEEQLPPDLYVQGSPVRQFPPGGSRLRVARSLE